MKKALFISFFVLLLSFTAQAQTTVFKAQVSNQPGIDASQLATPPVGWFRADDLIIDATESGAGVLAEWTPTIGGTSFLQSDETKQPALAVNSLNGHKTVKFDNVNDAMTSTINLGSGVFSIVIVYSILDSGTHYALQGSIANWCMGSISQTHQFKPGTPSGINSNQDVMAQNYVVAVARKTGSFSCNYDFNGTSKGTATMIFDGFGNLNLGAAGQSPTTPFNGNIAEIILCDYYLSDQEVIDLTNGIASFYNLTVDTTTIINDTIVDIQRSDGSSVDKFTNNTAYINTIEAITVNATKGFLINGAAANGTLLSGNGSYFVPTTATYPATTTNKKLLVSIANNVVDQLATANNGVLVTSGTGTPSISTDLPTGITIAGQYIYRAGGTDISPGDGGTGASNTATSGTLLRGNGSAFVPTTATYPATTTANRVLISTSNNVVGELATANSSLLVTDSGGTPSLATDLPAAITIGGAAINTPASTTTFSNKTLDFENTGNVITTVDEIWRQAAVMTATATAVFGDFNWTDLATAPTPTALNGSSIDLGHLVYSASATNSAVTYYRLPLSWVGTIDIEIIWSSSVGTNAVKWDVATAFGTASNPTFNTSQTATTTVAGADTDTVSTITGLTTTGAVAGDMMYVKVSRLGADAADTCTGTARLIGVTLKIRRQL